MVRVHASKRGTHDRENFLGTWAIVTQRLRAPQGYRPTDFAGLACLGITLRFVGNTPCGTMPKNPYAILKCANWFCGNPSLFPASFCPRRFDPLVSCSSHRRFFSTAVTIAAVALVLLPESGCQLVSRFRHPKGRTSPVVATTSNVPLGSSTPAAETLGPYDADTFISMTPRAQNSRVAVLMFHDVMIDRGREDRAVNATKAEFEEKIAWLENHGANFLTMEQLHRHLTRGEEVLPGSVVLTFDDNYQGFYDNAYPLLKEKKIPAAMFVHTNYVGDTSGKHPKMSWDTLRELDKDGLVTVCSHTLSHPPDLTKLAEDQQETELRDSKSTLEQQLGHPIPFFAYPVGMEDATTLDIAQRTGYTMAFTMHNGPAEESPGILTVNRYNYTQIEKGWDECRKAEANAPAALVDQTLAANPVLLQIGTYGGTKLGIVRGGTPSTWRSETGGRFSVGEFIGQAQARGIPAVAGMNGTFFANAALRGTDNGLIGPCKTNTDPQFYPELAAYRLPKLLNRPLVVWGPTRFAIVPFNPATMNDELSLKTFMSDFTDVFLAGAWIVHDGKARTREEMSAYSARDFNDPRRRAFLGITESGDVVLGGSLEVITTEQLAKAASAAGVKEAVLMDSGFSTSIVYDNKILVTGHTAKDLPSRAVPHAVLVSGTLSPPTDPEATAALQAADPAVGAVPAAQAQADAPAGASAAGTAHGTVHRRHRRR